MGWLIIDRFHGAARTMKGAIRLVYVMTVPGGIQAAVAWRRRRRRDEKGGA